MKWSIFCVAVPENMFGATREGHGAFYSVSLDVLAQILTRHLCSCTDHVFEEQLRTVLEFPAIVHGRKGLYLPGPVTPFTEMQQEELRALCRTMRWGTRAAQCA